jgi:hypothetical protein
MLTIKGERKGSKDLRRELLEVGALLRVLRKNLRVGEGFPIRKIKWKLADPVLVIRAS